MNEINISDQPMQPQLKSQLRLAGNNYNNSNSISRNQETNNKISNNILEQDSQNNQNSQNNRDNQNNQFNRMNVNNRIEQQDNYSQNDQYDQYDQDCQYDQYERPKKRHTVSKFFNNVISVDETRISVLMICLISTVLFGGIMYHANGTIDEHWVSVIETFAFCVTGINIAGAFANGNNVISRYMNNIGNNRNNGYNNYNNRYNQYRRY